MRAFGPLSEPRVQSSLPGERRKTDELRSQNSTLTMTLTDDMVAEAKEAFPGLSELEAVQKMASKELPLGLVAEGDDGSTIDSIEVRQVA